MTPGSGGGHRLRALLVALVVLFMLYPVMVHFDWGRGFRVLFGGVLIIAAWVVGGSRRHLLVAVLLGGPALASQALIYFAPSREAIVGGTLLGVAFLIYTTALVLRSVLAAGPVTADRIAGAISVYLLLGLVWAMLYAVVESASPGSFSLPAGAASGMGSGAEYAFLYYSFVTLTTLGYGEIAPLGPIGQSLAWMEAATGQLFLAILVARLVALHLAGERR